MAQQPPAILRLPVELRLKIYQYILISDRQYDQRTALWRPIGADEKIFKIGYFTRDSIMPLLLVNRQIHDEAATVLYGENTFVCQVSGFSDQPLAFLNHLPTKYLGLLRKFYVRTGCYVEGKIGHDYYASEKYADMSAVVKDYIRHRDIVTSAQLLTNAISSKYRISVNTKSVIRCPPREYVVENIEELWGHDHAHEWSYSSWHVWKLVLTHWNDGDVDDRRFEFRRLAGDSAPEWVDVEDEIPEWVDEEDEIKS